MAPTTRTHQEHRILRAGHWSPYENAPEVNCLMLELCSG